MTRTSTGLLRLEPESSASTNSAMAAHFQLSYTLKTAFILLSYFKSRILINGVTVSIESQMLLFNPKSIFWEFEN